MTTTDREVAVIAAGLTKAQIRVLNAAPATGWFPAQIITAQVIASAGSMLSLMNRKGLFRSKSDQTTWGRAVYEMLPFGLAIRAHLASQERDKA